MSQDKKAVWATVGFLLLILVTWCGYSIYKFNNPPPPPPEPQIETTQAEYLDEWPFLEYSSGVITCKNRNFGGVTRPLVLIRLGPKLYGLNGAAIGVGGYADAREAMAKHPEWGTFELGATSELISRGLELCGDNSDVVTRPERVVTYLP